MNILTDGKAKVLPIIGSLLLVIAVSGCLTTASFSSGGVPVPSYDYKDCRWNSDGTMACRGAWVVDQTAKPDLYAPTGYYVASANYMLGGQSCRCPVQSCGDASLNIDWLCSTWDEPGKGIDLACQMVSNSDKCVWTPSGKCYGDGRQGVVVGSDGLPGKLIGCQFAAGTPLPDTLIIDLKGTLMVEPPYTGESGQDQPEFVQPVQPGQPVIEADVQARTIFDMIMEWFENLLAGLGL